MHFPLLNFFILQFTMNKVKRIMEEKKRVAKLYGGRCFICEKKYGRGFLFHHRKYVQGERIYKDFKSSTAYNEYILPIIEADKEKRFSLLCSPCHSRIDNFRRGIMRLTYRHMLNLFVEILHTWRGRRESDC